MIHRHGDCRKAGGGSDGARADCSRASGGAPACGQPRMSRQTLTAPSHARPCGSPRPPRAMPLMADHGGDASIATQQRLVRDRAGFDVPDALPAGLLGVLTRRSWRRTRSRPCPMAAQTRRRPVGHTRAVGEVAALMAATSAAPKGRRSPSWPPAVHRPAWSTLRSASWRLSSSEAGLHRIDLAVA